MDSEKIHANEASEAEQLDHLPFTSTVADFILNKNFSNSEDYKSTLCRKSCVSSKYSTFLQQGKSTGWIGNTHRRTGVEILEGGHESARLASKAGEPRGGSRGQSRSQSPRSSVRGIVGLWEKAQKNARNSLHHYYRIQYTS